MSFSRSSLFPQIAHSPVACTFPRRSVTHFPRSRLFPQIAGGCVTGSEVILVKKSYEKRPRTRRWKLKRLPVEEDAANKARGEEEKRAGEYEDFLKDLEHNAEMWLNINLYKDEDYRSDMASTVGEDVPTVPIEELIEDLSLGDDEEDEGEKGNARASMVE